MFYCNNCAKENNYPDTMFKSVGKCEICGKETTCNELPSSKITQINRNNNHEKDYYKRMDTLSVLRNILKE